MKDVLRSAFQTAAGSLPKGGLAALLSVALGNRRLALCLHRVADRPRPEALLPEFTIAPDVLDSLIELLISTRSGDERWLTISFDDGYRDAAEYVLSRAPRYPQVEWLFFVCPEKTERGVGFRWDAVERRRARGETTDLRDFLAERHPQENDRAELLEAAQDPAFALADVALCRRIAALPNVTLGNHTDTHQRASQLSPEAFATELAESTARFERLFGPMKHFAFPFGVPGEDFTAEHVERIRERGPSFIWSTGASPYRADLRSPGAVLPRMVIEGQQSLSQLASWIALRAGRNRLSGSPSLFEGVGR
jgi:peptidoglycan/xylan/chitin deacetylase (PgdA/CDA1 family)